MQDVPVLALLVVVALALCTLLLIRRHPRKPMSRADFTQRFAKGLRSAMRGSQVVISGESQLQVKDANKKEHTLFLDNAYAEYVQCPKDLPEVVQKYIAAFAQWPASDAPIDRSRIVPVIKDRNWPAEIRESLKARGAEGPKENVFDDVNDELIAVYAEDSPKSIRYLTPENLLELGLTRGELRALAIENLQRLLPKIEVSTGPLVSMVRADGNYEASLLLFDELWSGGQIKVDGDIVVAVPARDVLLVTGSQNPAGIAKLRELAGKSVRESPYRLTDALFVYRDGSFKKLGHQ